MRIITEKRLWDAVGQHPRLRSPVDHWIVIARAATWKHFPDVRCTFPHADQVTVASGRTTTVFNLGSYRAITAIHYNHRKIFILTVLPHDEYEEGRWKERL